MRSLAVGLFIAGVLIVSPASVAPGIAASGSCARAKSKTVAENRFARVFTRPVQDPDGDPERVLIGCWKKTGRARPLGRSLNDIIIHAGFGLVRLHGRFAAYCQDSLDDCRYGECGVPGWHPYHLHRVDLRSNHNRSTGTNELPAAHRLLLDKHGAISWPRPLADNQIEVNVFDARGARAIDTGAIDPTSLRLTAGGRLSWINDGHARTTQLHHTP